MKTRVKIMKVELIYSTKTDGWSYNMNNNPFDCREKDWKIKQLFKDAVPTIEK